MTLADVQQPWENIAIPPNLEFANEEARVAWITTQQVRRVAAVLPPDPYDLDFEVIGFGPGEIESGLLAIFVAGGVGLTGFKSHYTVPVRTRRILDVLRIPYHVGYLNASDH